MSASFIGRLRNAIATLMDKSYRYNRDANNLLFYTAESGDVAGLKEALLLGADKNVANMHGITPLINAARNGHTECASLLIAAGANPNVADRIKWTPLMYAACHGHIDCLHLLLDAGGNVDSVNKKGNISLTYAASNGHTGCLVALVEAGADAAGLERDYPDAYRTAKEIILRNSLKKSYGDRSHNDAGLGL